MFQQTDCAEFGILFTSDNASHCVRSLSQPYAINEKSIYFDSRMLSSQGTGNAPWSKARS